MTADGDPRGGDGPAALDRKTRAARGAVVTAGARRGSGVGLRRARGCPGRRRGRHRGRDGGQGQSSGLELGEQPLQRLQHRGDLAAEQKGQQQTEQPAGHQPGEGAFQSGKRVGSGGCVHS